MDRRPSRMEIVKVIGKLNVKSVLAVGCGTGPFYPILKEKYPKIKYKGTDYSKRLIKIAKKEFPEADFEVQDMRKMKEKDNSWDLVLAYHALDHSGDWKIALKEMSRIARRYVIVALWRPFVDGETKTNATGFFGEDQYIDTYLNEFSKKELEDAMLSAGFTIGWREIIEDAENRETYIYTLVV